MESQACAKNAKTRLLGDTMSFYIAQRNKETGVFNLIMENDRPKQYHTLEQGIDMYELCFQAEGHNNVLLLESIGLDVKVSVKEITR